uniref:Uncharacterized protein n=1 Tax=Tetradesmus obliquus TaxID=3088 RepID=A0A383VN90_TETOB|eukprot:jgi/Sobl393_1/7927/SZX66289.1
MATGNHYSKQVAVLEKVLRGKMSQLSVLSAENQVLRQRERALQAYQASLAGGLHATKKVLREASFSSQAAHGSPASDSMSGEDGPATPTAPANSAGSHSFSDGPALLQKIDEREEAVQQALHAIGGCDQAAYDSLYTTQLLRRATSQPERTAAILNMSIPQRLAYVTKCVERFALLLPKYDRTGASTRLGPASEQTDRLVDELSEKALTFGLLDPPGVHLSECMINMETSQPEAYPDGWWDLVVEAMELTGEQLAALKVCYDRVKPVKDALTAQHAALAARLAQLQSSQHSKQRAFEHGAQQLYSRVHAESTHGAAASAAMTPQAALLARQAERAQQLQRQAQLQMQISGAAAAHAASTPQGGLLQLGSVALQAKVASAADAEQLAQLLEQSLQEAAKSATTGSGGATVAESVSSPACGAAVAATVSTATWPQAAATPALQQQQQQVRQVHFAVPVQQHSRVSPDQPQSSAEAAMQLQQSFLQADAAAAAAAAAASWQMNAGAAMPGSAAAAAASAASSPELAMNVESAAYQYAVIDTVLDSQLELDPGMDSGTAAAAAGMETLCSSSGNAGLAGSSSSPDNLLLQQHLQQQQQQQQQIGNTAAAAPAATAAGEGVAMLSRDEVAAAVLGAAQCSTGGGEALTSVIARSSSQCQRDLLMHLGCKEQQQTEQEMDRITAQLKMQQYCLALHLHNVCSKKQIALHYLHCFPFIPEAFSFFEALEATWAGQACKNNRPQRSR